MIKYTPNNLKKIESLFQDIGYLIRYEKGNFQSGYCILENKKVIIINKYYTTESRINSLLDIFDKIDVKEQLISDEFIHLYKSIIASKESDK